jgi:hypothetical protein
MTKKRFKAFIWAYYYHIFTTILIDTEEYFGGCAEFVSNFFSAYVAHAIDS